MKYLKRFEKLNNPSIKDDINDILIDIKQDKNLRISSQIQKENNLILIYIAVASIRGIPFSTNDIKDPIIHLISHMEAEGHSLRKVSVMPHREWEVLWDNAINSSEDKENIFANNIEYLYSFELKFDIIQKDKISSQDH